MKTKALLATLVCLGAVLLQCRPVAASEVLYDNTGFLQGQQSFSDAFYVTGPGTLTITLSNMAWPDALSRLDLIVSGSQGLLGPEMAAGTSTFQLAEAGTVYAQWFGAAQGPMDLGVYGVKITWSSSSVPLPASILLLLSGLAFLAWRTRAHAPDQRNM